jgi:uncharacterized cupredoxin-like copper-binding protein
METPLAVDSTATRPAGRKPLTALTKWTVATLVAAILLMVYFQVALIGSFSPPVGFILGLPALVLGLPIVVTRWRWAPLSGALYWILLIGLNTPFIPYDLSHPANLKPFAFTLVVIALAVVGTAAGIGAAIQNYRAPNAADEQRRVPRWFPTLLWSLAGLCLGAILVAAGAPARASAGIDPKTLATLPALTAVNTRFDQTEMRVKVGETVALRLENRDGFGHTFNVDEMNVHVSMLPGQASLALFKATTPGTYTFYCDVPGHRAAGMVGTLIVAP